MANQHVKKCTVLSEFTDKTFLRPNYKSMGSRSVVARGEGSANKGVGSMKEFFGKWEQAGDLDCGDCCVTLSGQPEKDVTSYSM